MDWLRGKGKGLVLLVTGIVAGIAIVVACGGGNSGVDAGREADAAPCECPTEEPIENRLRIAEGESALGETDTTGGVDATCTGGEKLLGGIECSVNQPGLAFEGTTTDGITYVCHWRKPAGLGGTHVIRAKAICLVPAGTPDAGL